MPHVPATLQNEPSHDPNWLKLRNVYERVARTLNGNVGFGGGDGTATSAVATPTTQGLTTDNINGVWVRFTTAAKNQITHNLGHIINGWIIMIKDAPVDLYLAPADVSLSTTTQVTLSATATGVSVHVFVL